MHTEQENKTRKLIGERIKTARILRDQTQMELADTTGIPQSQISRLERGLIEEPGIFQLQRLSRSLGISLEDFWSGQTVEFRNKVRGKNAPMNF